MDALTGTIVEYLSAGPLAGLGLPMQIFAATMIVINGILLAIITPYSLFAIWLERKVSGHMQDRVGPMIPGGWHGWAATIADGVKLLLKEDLIPKKADNFLFWLAPMLSFAGAFAVFGVIPWGVGLAPADLDVGAFFIIAISSLSTIGIIMAGWSSNNKYALYGGMRSAAQAVSFEIPLIMSLLPIVMVTGTLNLVKITELQKGGLLDWFVFSKPPFMFFAFIVFFIAALAEVNRAPFDMPEGDQEIVGGFHVEFCGIRFGMFFLGEYAAMLAQGLVVSVLFLGGWHGAYPVLGALLTGAATVGVIAVWLGTNAIVESFYPNSYGKLLPLKAFNGTMAFLVFLVPIMIGKGPVTLLAKGMFFIFLMIWLRWTLPRVRPDQLMYTCWKVLVPIALLNLVAVGGWLTWLS